MQQMELQPAPITSAEGCDVELTTLLKQTQQTGTKEINA
jgi:hypothetical protein